MAGEDITQPQEQEPEIKRVVNFKVAGTVIGLLAIVAAGVFYAFNFVEEERQRDLQDWQIRLGIVADSRAAAVSEWVDKNFASLRELAENASLQLYMTEILFAEEEGEEAMAEAQAQAGYLRNLLVATADRTGFNAPPPSGEIAANVERVGVAGIALLDKDGKLLVASPGTPPPSPDIKAAVAKALGGKPVLIDLYKGASDQTSVGFALPVYALQGDETEGIGVVLGIKLIGKDFSKTLEQPGEIQKTAETYLVRKNEGVVEYLTLLADGTLPLERTFAIDTPDLAAAFAVEKPGGFGVRRDYAGTEVLVTSRPIAGTPWVLARKVATSEALAETDTRLRTILVVFLLIIGGVSVTMVAVWRHGTSLRAAKAAEQFKLQMERFQNLSKFLNVVTNSHPAHIVAVTGDGNITFANKRAADSVGMEVDDMLGKNMFNVIGPIQAKAYHEINREVIEKFEPRNAVHRFEEADGDMVIKSDHVPLRGDRDYPPSSLMILDDITELTRERERRERVMRQLVETLVSVVDRRDPYSANHSARVAEVSHAIGEEMGLGELEQRTVDIAGSVMNLGKIFIPAELLTKTGKLTDEEREQLSRSFVVSADLLSGVEFDGPVVETVRQIGESWDGAGPLGMKGDEILVTARIVAVANVFVGMVSPRAYRDAMTFEKVAAILMEEAEKKFDRKAVVALINYIENRGGRQKWAHYRETPLDQG